MVGNFLWFLRLVCVLWREFWVGGGFVGLGICWYCVYWYLLGLGFVVVWVKLIVFLCWCLAFWVGVCGCFLVVFLDSCFCWVYWWVVLVVYDYVGCVWLCGFVLVGVCVGLVCVFWVVDGYCYCLVICCCVWCCWSFSWYFLWYWFLVCCFDSWSWNCYCWWLVLFCCCFCDWFL